MTDLKNSLINRAVADKLEGLRSESRMTLEQVAEVSGVPLSTVKRIFAPKQDIATSHLTAIAGALGSTGSEILRAALDKVGADEALADVQRILHARAEARMSAGRGTVTALHPRDMTADQLENLRHAATYDPEAETDEPQAP